MSQEANNWAHTSERGNVATALANAGITTTGAPTMSGGMVNSQPMVNSAELRPYQSGRLGLDSEMGAGINHHGPNGPYPTRAAGVSEPHQQQNIMNKTGVAGMHNEIAIPVASGPAGSALLANHPTATQLHSAVTDRNHDGIPDSQQRDRNHDGIPDSQQHVSMGDKLKNMVPGANKDKNHDGIPDRQQRTGMDLNRDGIPDSQQRMGHSNPTAFMTGGADRNHDGIPDSQQRDRNHDGIPDSQQHQSMGQKLHNILPGANKDKNHDGIPDNQQRGVAAPLGVGAHQSTTSSTYSGAHPASGVNTVGTGVFGSAHGHHTAHGAPSTASNLKDKNHDGIPDSQQHQTMGQKLHNMLPGANKDKNHDGIPDSQQRDRNHDGIPDNQQHGHTSTTTAMQDKNHDGIPDSQQHKTIGQKIAGIFGGNKDKNHDGIPDNQQHGTHAATSTHHHGDTVDVSNKPNADIWVPKQFGRMPPGSTIKDPAHHPGFATHVVTENIPVTDELGREATITKQTVITTQDTIMGLLRRDHELLESLFRQWFATRDTTQREQLWWEIEHELLSAHEGHNGVLHSAYNKHLTSNDGYDHSSSFRGYNDMHTLTTEMSKMNPSEPIFETKMTQLYGMYQNHHTERSRYLPLMETKLTNQQLIDMGTNYNLKKSGVKNTKHTSRLNQHNATSSTHGSTHGHALSEKDREHANMANKHVEEGTHHPTLKERIFGTKHTDTTTTTPATGHGVNTSTHTTATTTAPRK